MFENGKLDKSIVDFSILFLVLILSASCGDTESKSSGEMSEENIEILFGKDVLANQNWVYPNTSNVISEFSMPDDSTFTFYTKLSGGVTATGRWYDSDTNRVIFNFDSSGTQTIILMSENEFNYGSISYFRK